MKTPCIYLVYKPRIHTTTLMSLLFFQLIVRATYLPDKQEVHSLFLEAFPRPTPDLLKNPGDSGSLERVSPSPTHHQRTSQLTPALLLADAQSSPWSE